jgi:DNA-binding transcriptional MerR regulator
MTMNALAVNAGTEMVHAETKAAPDTKISRIGDLAGQFGITLRALRFYEDKGLITPERSGTTRLYSHRDRARLKLILLGRKVGFSLREVKQLLDLYDPSGSNATQLRATLDKTAKQHDKLIAQRSSIDEAIHEVQKLMATVGELLGKPKAEDARPHLVAVSG